MGYVCSNEQDGCSDFHARYPTRRQCPCTCHWGAGRPSTAELEAERCRNSVEILGEIASCWLLRGHIGKCQMKWAGDALTDWRCDSHPEVSVSVMGTTDDKQLGWVICAECVRARAIAHDIIGRIRKEHESKWHLANMPTCAMCVRIETYDVTWRHRLSRQR